MKRIGLTGGMGCGKTTVLGEFEKLGIPCFVADRVASEYYSDPVFLAELEKTFGRDVFDGQGFVDKRKLASIVFADETKLSQLNRLIHPRVMADFEHFCGKNSSAPYIIFESAILFEYGFDGKMDAVICVYLDLDERVRRLLSRDNSTTSEIMMRINKQLPAEVKMMRSNYVILNYENNPRKRQIEYIDTLLRQ